MKGFCSTLAGPSPFVFALCSLPCGHRFSTGVGSRKGAGKGREFSLMIPLCPGVIGSDLFSFFFFLFWLLFCFYFSFFLSVGIFFPQSLPGSPLPL